MQICKQKPINDLEEETLKCYFLEGTGRERRKANLNFQKKCAQFQQNLFKTRECDKATKALLQKLLFLNYMKTLFSTKKGIPNVRKKFV